MVYVFLADGFEEMEAIVPIDILRRADISVKTVAVGSKKTIESTRRIPVVADLLMNEVKLDEIEMIVLPGGQPGVNHLYDCAELRDIVQYAYEQKKYVAAICAAPLILGRLGILRGKKAVCYPGYEGDLTDTDVTKTETLVQDGKVITAKGAGVASTFAFKLVELLKDSKTSESIRKAMIFE
ncbi:MAG: DJ-1/PfpI family protein [Clostridiales bacterium]|nr:DJ-1/PfpI family protein [Clostridiales bacterium]